MKSDKRQTMVLVGVALLAVAGVLLYVALSQPRVYESGQSNVQSVQVVTNQSETPADNTEGEAPSYEYPINLNTATLDELMSIDGLGEARASAILEYRDYIGSYTDVSQIMDIKGISESVFADVAEYLTV